MTALHCGRVLALTRGNTGKVRKLFFSDSMALEDKAVVLQRNRSPTDRQQAIRMAKFGADVEQLYEMARRLRAKLENCYVKVKRYTVRVGAEEKKNPEFRKRTRRPRKVRRDKRGALSDEAYVREVLGEMHTAENILVINDEAHHAWRVPPKVRIAGVSKDELKEATKWWGIGPDSSGARNFDMLRPDGNAFRPYGTQEWRGDAIRMDCERFRSQ